MCVRVCVRVCVRACVLFDEYVNEECAHLVGLKPSNEVLCFRCSLPVSFCGDSHVTVVRRVT